jgi:hypothetical protein
MEIERSRPVGYFLEHRADELLTERDGPVEAAPQFFIKIKFISHRGDIGDPKEADPEFVGEFLQTLSVLGLFFHMLILAAAFRTVNAG